jgi:uncharacterized protein (TIGR02246 family)
VPARYKSFVKKFLLTACLVTTQLALPGSATAARAAPVRRCTPITWDQVAGLFQRWNQSFAEHDPAQVAGNYTRDALLLPAFANTPRTGRDAIRDYYAALLPLSPRARVVQRTIKTRCNLARDAGVLSLRLTDSGGVESVVPLQYSFVYEYRDGRWQIAHDHASVISNDEKGVAGALALPASAPAPTAAPTGPAQQP